MGKIKNLQRLNTVFESLSIIRVRKKALLGITLFFIISLAIGLRTYGLSWDQGYAYTPHPDERAILMKVAEISLPSAGNMQAILDATMSPLNPRWFAYGSFPIYLLKVAHYGYSIVLGVDLDDMRIIARSISVLADIGTLTLVYFLGSRIYGHREGIIGALLVALAVLHIQLSHYYAVDTLQALFALFAIFFMCRLARDGRVMDSALSGVFIGLGLATKFSQIPIYIPFLMAQLIYLLQSFRKSRDSGVSLWGQLKLAFIRLLAGIGASAAVFVLAQPYALLDWSTYAKDLVEQSEMVRRIRDYPYTRQYVDTPQYWYHIRQLATWGLGLPLGIVCWISVLWAAIKGLRFSAASIYIMIGLVLPALMLSLSTSLIVIIVATIIATVALVLTVPFRSSHSYMDLILLSWVIPYFLITGALEVKFLRYLTPITPVMLLLSARMLVTIWESAGARFSYLRPMLASLFILLLGSTGAYALGYMAVYSEPHTAVRTSEWIRANIPSGAVLLKEHWEEGLPGLDSYIVEELPMYDHDNLSKIEKVAEFLSEADYIVFFSNRLYGTIPRLPDRYPFSAEYYHLLFSGGLGYGLVNLEETHPRLGGVALSDNTFSRPGLPNPDKASLFEKNHIVMNLGFADESFSVYDHPKVMVFKNQERFSADALVNTIKLAATAKSRARSEKEKLEIGAMFSGYDYQVQRLGGTWTNIISSNSWADRNPVLIWLLAIEIFALVAMPINWMVFRPLADSGYIFSKLLGVLLVSFIVWLLASLHLMEFSRLSVLVGLLLVGLFSTAILVIRRREFIQMLRNQWKQISVAQAIFLIAFLSFVLIRMANPDLWHPFRGGEKPMELAYLNAIVKSSYMPPYDPWFAGGYINYYYYGLFVVGMLIKATGVHTAVAFNLAVPLFFALTFGGAFTVVYNLAETSRRKRGKNKKKGRFGPTIAGLVGAIFVSLLGNLDGAVQVLQGMGRVALLNLPFGEFDFWRSSRLMPPDPPGFEITEFPFFTFLFADLHPSLISIPFTLVVLGLAMAIVLHVPSNTQIMVRVGKFQRFGWSALEISRLAVLGLLIGCLMVTNTWDYPTYLLVGIGAVFLSSYFKNGGLGVIVLLDTLLKSGLVLMVGYLAFLPYHLNYETFFKGIVWTTNQTPLWQFLEISGLFIFIIVSFLLIELRGRLSSLMVITRAKIFTSIGYSDHSETNKRFTAGGVLSIWCLLGLLVISIIFSTWTGSTITFLLAILGLVLMVAVRIIGSSRPEKRQMLFVGMIVSIAIMLVIGVDIFRLEGDVGRMNSVFKFYLQIWVLFAVAASYMLWAMTQTRWVDLYKLVTLKRVWTSILTALMIGASIYTFMGTHDRIRDRFAPLPDKMTLDGMAYMDKAVYIDPNGPIELSYDKKAIEWIHNNISGSPILMEGMTPMYRWGGRVSIYTGLPGVVGWKWHQEQQRWEYRHEVKNRISDVNYIYRSLNTTQVLYLLRKYGVEYIYVGALERLYYPEDGIEKFNEMIDDMDAIYVNKDVVIYKVRYR